MSSTFGSFSSSVSLDGSSGGGGKFTPKLKYILYS